MIKLFFITMFVASGQIMAGDRLAGQSFTEPNKNLSNEQFDQFILGKSFFRIPWVEAPSATTARDGLGPLFSANTCVNCHQKNGRGKVFDHGNVVDRSYVVRLSIPSNGADDQILLKHQGFVAEPTYGAQFSVNGVKDVPFEGKVEVSYQALDFVYPDGTLVMLQKPNIQLTQLGYGEMHPQTIVAARVAPALVGLGLIEQISDAQILSNEDVDDTNDDGISGKANRVWSKETNQLEVGRYTWKAATPSVRHQSANAAASDMGLTNPLHPEESCTQAQLKCLGAPKGDYYAFDLPDKRLNAISFYLRQLALPSTKPIQHTAGQVLFESLGCAMCHRPSYQLSSGKTISPYSDFLLHDMGSGLADGRQEYLASGSEWRTPPLWHLSKVSQILGKQQNFLHDGRARTLEEAILWHGGEAKDARAAFVKLPLGERQALLKFLGEI